MFVYVAVKCNFIFTIFKLEQLLLDSMGVTLMNAPVHGE